MFDGREAIIVENYLGNSLRPAKFYEKRRFLWKKKKG